jgi:FKBP-type peptidyl-prolyl cis-trans isomerase SlpA
LAASRIVRPGDTILLHYRLSTAAGEEVCGNFDEEPETFVIGAGELAENLERLLIGHPEDTHECIQLPPEAAFGEPDPTLVREIAREDFPAGFPLIAESLVEFRLPDGRTANGIVREWTDDSVSVDFNHPLCGCPIVFEFRIVEIC